MSNLRSPIYRLPAALSRAFPRRLVTRITLAVVGIVVPAGMITLVVINLLLGHYLRAEMAASGASLARALGDNVSNALVDGDLAAIQEALNGAVSDHQDITYAYAFGPDTPVIHTFPNGFPAALLSTTSQAGKNSQGLLLKSEKGLVRDFTYRPLGDFPAEVHLGISESRITAVQNQATAWILGLTLVGCLLAAGVAYALSRLATRPLVALTEGVQRLGRGHFDQRIEVPEGSEVGDLAVAFNQMSADIQQAIASLRLSEASAQDLLTAAGAVGEGIALICDEGEGEGTFLFVNRTFAALAGHQEANLVGTNAASILHPDSLEAVRRAWQAIRSGTSRQTPTEIVLVDRHGQGHVLETAGTLVEYQGRRALAWFTRDVTERKMREDEIRRRNRELTALYALASATSEPLSAKSVLKRALRQVLKALDLEVGWVFLLTSDGKGELAASYGLAHGGGSFGFPACECGAALRENRPVLVKSAGDHCPARRALRKQEGGPCTCHATVPLVARGRTLGVLSVASADPQHFRQAEMDLLKSVGQQMGVALENARLWDELREKEQLRGELLARSIRAQEDERQRIARELHDATGQSLNALVFGLNAASTALGQSPEATAPLLERLRVSASDTVRELQGIIYDLRPSLLDDLGLVPALRWYADERLQSRGVDVTIEMSGEATRLPSEVETALFRIAQEAVTNIGKHADARHVRIALQVEAGQVVMTVEDDGVGFTPASVLSPRERSAEGGFGLLGMQERTVLLGGTLSVSSAPGKGTRLHATIPFRPQAGDSQSKELMPAGHTKHEANVT
ncbi:MAG TPA: GAF domain-containing protein [Chloroflexia bacterium]|nr:GAF domain-containing protein [Chloroflexia bacterium]